MNSENLKVDHYKLCFYIFVCIYLVETQVWLGLKIELFYAGVKKSLILLIRNI